MKWQRLTITVSAAVVAVLATWPTSAAQAHAMSPAVAQPSTRFDRSEVSIAVGDRFTLTSTSTGLDLTQPLIAHLNVVSLTPDVYVDPEDWSSQRTQSIASSTLTWQLQAVNAGQFDVYVVIAPTAGSGPLSVSEPVHVIVAKRRAVNAGGALPVAIAVPVLLGAALLVNRLRSRSTND